MCVCVCEHVCMHRPKWRIPPALKPPVSHRGTQACPTSAALLAPLLPGAPGLGRRSPGAPVVCVCERVHQAACMQAPKGLGLRARCREEE